MQANLLSNGRVRFTTSIGLLTILLFVHAESLVASWYRNMALIGHVQGTVRSSPVLLEKSQTLLKAGFLATSIPNRLMPLYFSESVVRALEIGLVQGTQERSIAQQVILEAQIQKYREQLAAADPPTRLRFVLGKHLVAHGEISEGIEMLKLAIRLDSDVLSDEDKARAYALIGQHALEIGYQDVALENFLVAVSADPHVLESYVGLLDIYRQQHDILAERALLSRLEELSPTYTVNARVGDWLLEGFDVDLDFLQDTWTVPAWLYWRGPVQRLGTVENGFKLQARLLEFRWLDNPVLNAGFERELTGRGKLPYGYTSAYPGSCPIGNYGVVEYMWNGQPSKVALLDNRLCRYSGLASLPIDVQSGDFYLLSAWAHVNQGGKRAVGLFWRGTRRQPPYEYVSTGQKLRDWNVISGIKQVPTDSTMVQVWLLNYQGTGQTMYDNVLFARIEPPD